MATRAPLSTSAPRDQAASPAGGPRNTPDCPLSSVPGSAAAAPAGRHLRSRLAVDHPGGRSGGRSGETTDGRSGTGVCISLRHRARAVPDGQAPPRCSSGACWQCMRSTTRDADRRNPRPRFGEQIPEGASRHGEYAATRDAPSRNGRPSPRPSPCQRIPEGASRHGEYAATRDAPSRNRILMTAVSLALTRSGPFRGSLQLDAAVTPGGSIFASRPGSILASAEGKEWPCRL